MCSTSPSCLLTKVLLQEGQDGPHHNFLTFVRVQGSTSVTGKEFSKQVAGHESKVSLTPMNSSARDKEKQQVGKRVEVGHTCVPTMCKVLPVCRVALPATLSGSTLRATESEKESRDTGQSWGWNRGMPGCTWLDV